MLKKLFFACGCAFMALCTFTGCSSDEVLVFDALAVQGASYSDLEDQLGAPDGEESWGSQGEAGNYEGKVYHYSIDGNYYEFYLADDKVVRMDAYSAKSKTGQGEDFPYTQSNKSDSLEVFGIVPSETAEAADYDEHQLRIINVCDSVDEFWAQGADEERHVFSSAKITFDSKYF